MKKKRWVLAVALFAIAIPLFAIVSGQSLTNKLKDLCTELRMTCQQRSKAQRSFDEDYERQHQKMLDVINKSNDLSILLYTQEQNMTFDLTYALKKVSSEYKDFSKDRRPYDLIKQVALPAMVFLSLPMCIHLSLNVFDFNDLFVRLYCDPFVQFVDKNGQETLTISARSIVNLLILFYILRYVNRAIHTIWRYVRYMAFMHRHKRDSIRANEINLSLANSLISVLIWFAYVIVVAATWKMPVGSLTLVAGGLSAGIGIALKDIINNFIYGIQLMGGRLRVGDWIECDGVRGKVASINYQCVQMETLDGTEMSFLNATLFGKNFTNLTRNNSYEFTKIIAGVAYGTDIKKVREVLTEAMEQVRTKDQYGREIVEPKYGIKVVVGDMADSSVNIAVKQYVLVPERIGYVDRSKEVIYEALNAAGITIPFPQCDVHLIKDDTL